MAAAVALALLIALVPGRHLGLQQLVELFLYAASYEFLEFSLDYGPFSCTIFSDMVCCLFSNGGVATSFYQRPANHIFLFLRNLFYLIHFQNSSIDILKK